MYKIILTIIFSITFLTCSSQQILHDLSNYKSTKLANGLTVISVKTNEFDLVNYKFVVDFHENSDNSYPGTIDVLSFLMGCEIANKTEIYKNMVSDTNAIDSLLGFMGQTVLLPNFESTKIESRKVKNIYNLQFQNIFLQIGKKFSFGKNSSFSKFPTEYSINSISKIILQQAHLDLITPNNAYIIAVGNIEHDTLLKYVNKNFGFWQGENIIDKHETPSYSDISKINFIEKLSLPLVSIRYPISHYYTDDDFFAVEINSKVFENKITEAISDYTNNIDFDIEIAPVSSEFYLLFETKQDSLYEAIKQSYRLLLNLLIYPIEQNEINIAKREVTKEFSKTLKNPYNIANYAYITEKNNLPKYFFLKYNENINKTTELQVNNTNKTIYRPDNSSILLQATEKKITCQLYSLAKFFRIEFLDKNLNKYDIIEKGFDSYYIINDYLNACNANTNIHNLTVKFNANYLADTSYLIEGIIYKKFPNYYYYKTELIIGEDTLLQELQIANKDVWLDSTALGATFAEENVFWAKIYQAYIFPELYYKELEYKPNFICDTALINKSVFKIKVETPYDVVFYDYYDFDKKEKVKTETVLIKNGKSETVQIVNYSNYQRISKDSDVKMPFTITQIVGEIFFTINITEIDDKKRVKKKIFDFEKPESP